MYETLDHQADVGIKGYGEDWEEAFQEAAKAMFSLMTDLEEIKTEKTYAIQASSDEIDTLLTEFLNELIYLQNIHESMFSEFDIKITDEYQLKGEVKGQKIDEETELKTEVKAATYSGLEAGEEDGKKFVKCLLDI